MNLPAVHRTDRYRFAYRRLLKHGLSSLLLPAALLWHCQSQQQEAGREDSSAFTDVTADVGLHFMQNPGVDGSYFMPESIGSGAALFDYDSDGDLDIYFVNGAWHGPRDGQQPPLQNRLFEQQSDGTFVDVTAQSGLGDGGYGMGVAVGDIDNDGDPDVYVTNYGPDALYRNNGDGTFLEITTAAGIDNPAWGCSALFFDYDRDGWLDLFVTNYIEYDSSAVCTDFGGRRDYCGPTHFPGAPDRLYRNNGDGSFSDVSMHSGIGAVASVSLGVVSADFDGDTWPDVFVANDGRENQLWLNNRDGTFRDEAAARGIAVNNEGYREAGMGIALGDVDGDLDLDVFLTHLRTETNTLYLNDGRAHFRDVTLAAGLAGPSLPYTGFGTGFFDFDHDGDLDLAVANGRVTRGPRLTVSEPPGFWDDYAEPNLFFENLGNTLFRESSARAGAFCREHVANSRGMAFGDLDNDGDVDLLLVNVGGLARLFRNDAPKKGNWLRVRALLADVPRDAIGAEMIIFTGTRRRMHLVAPGYSFLSSNDPRVHFGLGQEQRVDSIQVKWPDGRLEMFPGSEANREVVLVYGQGMPQSSTSR